MKVTIDTNCPLEFKVTDGNKKVSYGELSRPAQREMNLALEAVLHNCACNYKSPSEEPVAETAPEAESEAEKAE